MSRGLNLSIGLEQIPHENFKTADEVILSLLAKSIKISRILNKSRKKSLLNV